MSKKPIVEFKAFNFYVNYVDGMTCNLESDWMEVVQVL